INPILVRLMRKLAPHGSMVLRIGGKTADAAWWPVHGMLRPGGVDFTVNRRFLAVLRALSDATGHHLIVDLNLEAPSPKLPVVEAQAFLRGLGRTRIATFELGNEPEMWASWPWYRKPNGRGVFARRHRNYDYAKYIRDASRLAKAIPRVPSAGPTDWSLKWIPKLPKFIRGVPRLGMVALHRYPLARCFTPWWSPQFPTIANLLWHGEADTLADELRGDVRSAHA